MLREEFEKITGFYPSQELYNVIEKRYMLFKGDKVAFCSAYKADLDGLATSIQREADMLHSRNVDAYEKQKHSLEQRIDVLSKELEREQEWSSYSDVHNVSQSDYKKLSSVSDVQKMTESEAKELLYDWYGFAPDKVTICCTVPVYEVNRHGRLRKIGEYDRSPLYCATDWNYIRFDCCCMRYELFNDNLRKYYQ